MKNTFIVHSRKEGDETTPAPVTQETALVPQLDTPTPVPEVKKKKGAILKRIGIIILELIIAIALVTAASEIIKHNSGQDATPPAITTPDITTPAPTPVPDSPKEEIPQEVEKIVIIARTTDESGKETETILGYFAPSDENKRLTMTDVGSIAENALVQLGYNELERGAQRGE